MAPFGGEPGVVEIEPANHRTDIEGCVHRIELPFCSWHPRAVNQRGAWNDGAEMLGAFRIAQGEQAAAEGVDQIITGGVEDLMARRHVVRRIFRQLD